MARKLILTKISDDNPYYKKREQIVYSIQRKKSFNKERTIVKLELQNKLTPLTIYL